MENQVLTVIIVVSAVIFAAATIFYYPRILKKLLVRLTFGAAGIAGANYLLTFFGAGVCVGLNPVSLLIMLVMGGPGLLLLYGVEAYCRIFP